MKPSGAGKAGPTQAADQASRPRQSLVGLRDQSAQLLAAFLGREPLVRACVYRLRRKCGKASCACAAGGALHSSQVITWRTGGRKRPRTLSPREQLELPRLVARHRRYRRARARLIQLHAEMLAVIDRLEALRSREP